jgi:hypothetical protein
MLSLIKSRPVSLLMNLLRQAYEYVKGRGWSVEEYNEDKGVLKFKYGDKTVTVGIVNIDGVEEYDIEVEGYWFGYTTGVFNEDAIKMAMNEEGAFNALQRVVWIAEARSIADTVVKLLGNLGYEASVKSVAPGEFTISFKNRVMIKPPKKQSK